ncbi:hypothetical protein HGB07_09800, partial [Candidatus Roizmanbacteria bacterium]|nr:hypothetical protein [Candidatus Roizmanbacteria bacterium]
MTETDGAINASFTRPETVRQIGDEQRIKVQSLENSVSVAKQKYSTGLISGTSYVWAGLSAFAEASDIVYDCNYSNIRNLVSCVTSPRYLARYKDGYQKAMSNCFYSIQAAHHDWRDHLAKGDHTRELSNRN